MHILEAPRWTALVITTIADVATQYELTEDEQVIVTKLLSGHQRQMDGNRVGYFTIDIAMAIQRMRTGAGDTT